MSQIENPGFYIAYDGILSDKLNWREDRLSRLSKEADLRSTVIIKTGHERLRSNIADLGMVAALKRTLRPSEQFSLISEGEDITIEENYYDEGGGRFSGYTVYINDQVIRERVMERNKGRFDEKLFVEHLNKSSREGIRTVIASEKKLMLLQSAFFGTLYFVSGGATITLSIGAIAFMQSTLQEPHLLKIAANIGLFPVYLSIAAIDAIWLKQTARSLKSDVSFFPDFLEPKRTMRSVRDYIIPKHAIHWMTANFNLARSSRIIVEYQPLKEP